MIALAPDKITRRHREREAYVYVRQSTLKQVQQNPESRLNQYALVQRAIDLGWLPERIQVIDCDLGQSGQDSQRPGFQSLVAAVSLGKVGLILAYEASRLARNNTDWYTLLDLATVVGVLIADTEGIYDPRDYNDRLLLGLRGLLSEAELHTLRLRMDAGRQRQIEQGRYQQHVPTGLVRLEDGRVSKTPDMQVQRTLELIFARFETLGSCQKVMRSLRDDGILLPRHQRGGPYAGQVIWRKPTQAALSEILHNPAYAGAFAYGRRGLILTGESVNCVRSAVRWKSGRRSTTECTLHISRGSSFWPIRHAWRTTPAILSGGPMASATRERAASRPRRVWRCGYQMRVTYKPHQRYTCTALAASYGAATCLHVDGACLEAVVIEAFFQALAPAELNLLEEVLAAQRADVVRLEKLRADQLARAEYEATLAQRSYQAVDQPIGWWQPNSNGVGRSPCKP